MNAVEGNPLIAGPDWSPSGLRVFAGRFPLSVEAHVLRMVALLVPGATTVTPHSRYFSLHALAAVESDRRGLAQPAALELLRRCEVVLGAISLLHSHEGFPRPHGADVIAPKLERDGVLRVAALERPRKGGYVQADRGFWGPYVGSELLLQVVDNGRIPTPGQRCSQAAVTKGLDGLLELAAQDEVSVEALKSASHLCLCAGADRADGRWLRGLLCTAPDSDAPTAVEKIDLARRETARLLARVMDRAGPATSFGGVFKREVAFGRFIDEDPVAAACATAQPWRGLLLRHYTVGAWRRLWSWLVFQVDDLMPPSELGARMADELPDETVRDFLEGLPPTSAKGVPLPAEELARAGAKTLPVAELAVLALGARRVGDLNDAARDAFVGRNIELGPLWAQQRFSARVDQHLRDFGRDLVADLLVRARRIAMLKMRRGKDGRIELPTRLHERGGLLYRTSQEGAGDVGLRLDQLGTVLAGVGVFAWGEGGWALTEVGRAALS